jgi:dTDP-L-rhamnose 4-epimerase
MLRDPTPRRDFLHVDDVAEAILAALRSPQEGFAAFNVCSGLSISVEDLVSMMRRLSERPFNVGYSGERRRGEIADVVGDFRKAASLLGWTPRIALEDGLAGLLAKSGWR